jgi:hypothetical protein
VACRFGVERQRQRKSTEGAEVEQRDTEKDPMSDGEGVKDMGPEASYCGVVGLRGALETGSGLGLAKAWGVG